MSHSCVPESGTNVPTRRPRRIVLLHGFNVADPMRSLGILAPHFREMGYETWVPDLGFLRWLWTRRKSELVARDLVDNIREGDAFVAHSNGCFVFWYLSHYDIPRHRVVLINPALETHMAPGQSCEFARVCWNPYDEAVKLGSRVPFSSWGRQGATGYRPRLGWPADTRIENFRLGKGHSPYRADPKRFAQGCSLFFNMDSEVLRRKVREQWIVDA